MRFSVGMGGLRFEVAGIQGLITLGGLVLVGLAVAEQLRLPPAQRTWQGYLGSVVPYDFRMPSVEKIVRSMWDPENDQIVKDKSFGVGWDVNLAALARALAPKS